MSRINKTYYLDFTGCYRAHVDAELICAELDQAGYKSLNSPENAEFLIFLGCSFIELAREESIQRILELSAIKNDQAVLIAGGCLFRRHQKELKKYLTEVDLWVNGSNPQDFLGTIQKGRELSQPQIFPAISGKRSYIGSPHYAYVKISEGCRNNCSYCAIPHIRGKHRSRPAGDIVDEIIELQQDGVKEVILVAQDSTSYGVVQENNTDLISLLTQIESVLEKEVKYRLLYLHPQGLSTSLFEFIAGSDKILKMLEIPIQHVSDRILTKMNRNYSGDDLEKLFSQIKSIIPEAGLRTTLLSGFPGETIADHEKLTEFIKQFKFQRLGVFSYSREENTSAGSFSGQISAPVKKKRKLELNDIAEQIMQEEDKNRIGKKIPAIVDGFYLNYPVVRTDWDLPEIDKVVLIRGSDKLDTGQWITIKLTEVDDHQIWGEVDEQ
ncbi:MAG: 30S ribosomal protein S12 methylthiotransferase RimO [bacterium]